VVETYKAQAHQQAASFMALYMVLHGKTEQDTYKSAFYMASRLSRAAAS